MLFEAPAISSDALTWDELPALRADTSDPQYAWLSNIGARRPRRAAARPCEAAPEPSVRRCGWPGRSAALQLSRPARREVVNEMLAADPWEWRAVWVSGLAALSKSDFRGAQSAFNAVYGQVPGELAPKLALALACEQGGEGDIAERLYRPVRAPTPTTWRRPPSAWPGSGPAAGTCRRAVQALDLVPTTSRAGSRSRGGCGPGTCTSPAGPAGARRRR